MLGKIMFFKKSLTFDNFHYLRQAQLKNRTLQLKSYLIEIMMNFYMFFINNVIEDLRLCQASPLQMGKHFLCRYNDLSNS